MTPQEIVEYKQRWMNNSPSRVKIHSDSEWACKLWCKNNIPQHQWKFTEYTNNYEHTIWFEIPDHAQQFSFQFVDSLC